MRSMSYNTQSTSPGPGSNRGSFESTLRRMWDTRPVRFPRSQSTRSWLFGVCEGIAVRYQVSPVLVRLLFVLLSLTGGIGIWVYGIALLVFRRYTVPKTPLEVLARSERDPRYDEDRSLAIGTLVVGAVFLVFGGIFSGGITLTGLVVSAGLTCLVWWLLHERQPVAPVGLLDRDDFSGPSGPASGSASGPGSGQTPDATSGAPSAATSGQDEEAPTINLDEVSAAAGFEPPRRQPPAWDPLGTAPFAWDLPDPDEPMDDAAQHSAPKKKRRGVKALTVAAVLAVILALVAGVIFLAGMFIPRWGGMTSSDGSSTTSTFVNDTVDITEVESSHDYTFTMSSGELDFTGATVNQDSTVNLTSTMSSTDLTFPRNTDGPSYRVDLNCESTTMSEVDCNSLDGTVVEGSGDPDDEYTLTVNVTATMSEVRFSQVG